MVDNHNPEQPFNIDWSNVLKETVTSIEEQTGIKIIIEQRVIDEIDESIQTFFSNAGLTRPNVYKVAAIVAFWIRKLKPIMIHPDSVGYYVWLNELVALKVGLAVCERYFDDAGKKQLAINQRVLKDWVLSWRYHSHSPHSSIIAFEMLFSEN